MDRFQKKVDTGSLGLCPGAYLSRAFVWARRADCNGFVISSTGICLNKPMGSE